MNDSLLVKGIATAGKTTVMAMLIAWQAEDDSASLAGLRADENLVALRDFRAALCLSPAPDSKNT
jgi:hypothetical protein